MSILDGIRYPSDLKRLPVTDLPEVARDLRDEILMQVGKTGGHLGASLGAVELTLALHYVFDAPRDQIVWDVGHQAYGHKIITGRRERFHTLRQRHGISGFPKRDESEYDTFGVAHASTAISAALGMATARDLSHEHFKVVAVVGDGALTGGMAFEALNNAGMLKKDLIVVLNDNRMSISHNV
jgi:1-deoxy-D-xylulose-5-phosphate synthase